MITAVQGMPPLAVPNTDAARAEADERRTQERPTRSTDNIAVQAREEALRQQAERPRSESPANRQLDFSQLNSKLQDFVNDSTFAKFSIDENSRRFVVQFIDKETDEVVRQFPPEESLRIAQLIASQLDNMQGNLTDAKV